MERCPPILICGIDVHSFHRCPPLHCFQITILGGIPKKCTRRRSISGARTANAELKARVGGVRGATKQTPDGAATRPAAGAVGRDLPRAVAPPPVLAADDGVPDRRAAPQLRLRLECRMSFRRNRYSWSRSLLLRSFIYLSMLWRSRARLAHRLKRLRQVLLAVGKEGVDLHGLGVRCRGAGMIAAIR